MKGEEIDIGHKTHTTVIDDQPKRPRKLLPGVANMTIVDHFAALAMQGILAGSNVSKLDAATLADTCYDIAEKMINERHRRYW